MSAHELSANYVGLKTPQRSLRLVGMYQVLTISTLYKEEDYVRPVIVVIRCPLQK